jgi:predicted transcriptional regulator
MTTTTLRLDAPLRQRIVDLALQTGQSAHNFMVEALTEKTEEAEWRLAIAQEAAQRSADMQASQQGLDWHDVREWALARAAKLPVKPLQTKSFADIIAAQDTRAQRMPSS